MGVIVEGDEGGGRGLSSCSGEVGTLGRLAYLKILGTTKRMPMKIGKGFH